MSCRYSHNSLCRYIFIHLMTLFNRLQKTEQVLNSVVFLTGESNVYTLGTIGAHRVVTTKLPSVGRTREAMTAAGNTTTRLLGIFQKVCGYFVTLKLIFSFQVLYFRHPRIKASFDVEAFRSTSYLSNINICIFALNSVRICDYKTCF